MWTSRITTPSEMATTYFHSAAIKECIDRMNMKIKGRLEGHYQHEGVRWMLQREFDPDVKGGMLCDDMGLGKTIQSIALICANDTISPTLIITTVGTVGQWRDALISFGGLRPIIVNSSFSGLLPDDAHVVITAYSSFQKSKGQSPSCFNDLLWGRIILDEGHTIRNKTTKVYEKICSLRSVSKWILSGTPLQNSVRDILNLAEWVGVDVRSNCSKSKNLKMDELERICGTYVLRRTQENEGLKNPRLALPPLETTVVKLGFVYNEEKELYKNLERYFTEQLYLVSSQKKYLTVVEGITRCRQACTHIQLYMEGIEKKYDKEMTKTVGIYKRKRDSSLIKSSLPQLTSIPSNSTKIDYICDDIYNHTKRYKNKCLVFCMWTLEMKLIQAQLKQKGVSALVYDGKLKRDDKEDVLYNFKNSSIGVLILQIVCGSTGLNLECSNRVYITSPNWNPCIELQAISRAYRKGQLQKVTCIRIVMENTIEERCLEIQNKKMELIKSSFDDDTLCQRLGGINDITLSDADINNCFKRST